MYPVGKLAFSAALAALSLVGGERTVFATGPKSSVAAHRPGSQTTTKCPQQEEIERTLGQASNLLEQAKYKEAAAILETLTGARCDHRAYLLLAAALEASGEVTEAEDTLQTAHSIWPSNTSIASSLAREYLRSGQINKAVKALDGFRATPATPPQEMEIAVVVYLAGHQLVSAQTVAEIAFKHYPALNTLLLLANVLQLEGRYKSVNRLLEDQRKTYADSIPFLITFAESEFDAMLYDVARADLEHAIALDNNSYQAHYLLGNVLVAQNEIGRAETEYRTAISLAPNQPRTYYQLALLLHSRQDDADEEPLLTRALAVDDHYAPAYCEMGRILLGQRQLADAVKELKLAIQYNPQLEQAYYLLARAYAGLGQKDKADATVKRYRALRAANRHSSEATHPSELGIDTGTH
jgi:Tfp pilus assembly protein PilF